MVVLTETDKARDAVEHGSPDRHGGRSLQRRRLRTHSDKKGDVLLFPLMSAPVTGWVAGAGRSEEKEAPLDGVLRGFTPDGRSSPGHPAVIKRHHDHVTGVREHLGRPPA